MEREPGFKKNGNSPEEEPLEPEAFLVNPEVVGNDIAKSIEEMARVMDTSFDDIVSTGRPGFSKRMEEDTRRNSKREVMREKMKGLEKELVLKKEEIDVLLEKVGKVIVPTLEKLTGQLYDLETGLELEEGKKNSPDIYSEKEVMPIEYSEAEKIDAETSRKTMVFTLEALVEALNKQYPIIDKYVKEKRNAEYTNKDAKKDYEKELDELVKINETVRGVINLMNNVFQVPFSSEVGQRVRRELTETTDEVAPPTLIALTDQTKDFAQKALKYEVAKEWEKTGEEKVEE